jgi:hypothetical protein
MGLAGYNLLSQARGCCLPEDAGDYRRPRTIASLRKPIEPRANAIGVRRNNQADECQCAKTCCSKA